jgi:hypothetical protein
LLFNFTQKSKARGMPRHTAGTFGYRIALARIGLVRISMLCTASERAVLRFAARALRNIHWHAACMLEMPPVAISE